MRIAVIKLGAKGDVIRTIPIVEAIRKKHPGAEIHWITKSSSVEILKNLDFITVHKIPYLAEGKFDIMYNFDLEEEATSLAAKIEAEKKYGFYSEGGYPSSYNPGAEYYLNTYFDDALKKENKRTYQEMMFELADLPYENKSLSLSLSEEARKYGEDFIHNNSLEGKKILGIHMGSSHRWPSKAWSEENVAEFIRKADKKGYKIILFGGPDEAERHGRLFEKISQEIKIYKNDPMNTDNEFAALLSICDTVVCSDTYTLHLALSLKRPTIALFFCTSPTEVEGYGLLKKIISPKLQEFFPERSDEYNIELVNSISADEVARNLD